MKNFKIALQNPMFQKKLIIWMFAVICIIMTIISAYVEILKFTIPIFMIGAILFAFVSFGYTVKLFLRGRKGGKSFLGRTEEKEE